MTAWSSTAFLISAALTFAACGDDGNDGDLQARRATERAAELRAAATVPIDVGTEVGVDALNTTAGTTPPTASTAPVVTAATVEPTGVVIPVVALDNSFRPEKIQIAVGDEVLWENRGINDHNVLYVDGDDWGIEVEGFGPGAAYAHVFDEPGEYRYFCSIHGNETIGMVGTITVVG